MPSSLPTASATAPKSSLAGTPCATSVATRRSAACSSASRASFSVLALFEIVVATSSVNSDEPILDVVGQRLACRDTGTHHAPELAVDDDRRADA